MKEDRLREQVATLEERRAAAVEAERRRIADELHDVIAHELTRIAMHVEVLDRAKESEQRQQSTSVIRISSQQALRDTRRVLKLVREPHDDDEAGPAEVDSSDLIVSLEESAEELRELGLTVSSEGPSNLDLPASIRSALVQACRECVNNIAKHSARDGDVCIELAVDEGEVSLKFTNPIDAPWTPDPELSSGYGLPRLRERIALLDGRLSAGPRGSQWRTEITVPRG